MEADGAGGVQQKGCRDKVKESGELPGQVLCREPGGQHGDCILCFEAPHKHRSKQWDEIVLTMPE